MSKHQIPIYRAEREAGVAELVRSNASIAYLVQAEPILSEGEVSLSNGLKQAFASDHKGDFDLYYMKDIMVTTGWNKNRDVFDKTEAWSARHTPEDKPFNFEHRPLDIIGHITASHVIDENMVEIPDDRDIEDVPDKFHIVNGSVLYMELSDPERKELMRKTVEEIKAGEWFVSMEALFHGFDYAVIGPDGSHRVLPRNETTAFLTKHLAQYGGTGVYKSEEDGREFTLGRLLKNITFSGKGLVRKPANPNSIILNSVGAFAPTHADLGYLNTYEKSNVEPSSALPNEREALMPENNNAEQALKDLNSKLEQQVASLQSEITGLKNKDAEVAIANLRKDVADRDAVIAEREKTISGLQTQIATITDSSKTLEQRAQAAETALSEANESLKTLKLSETKRAREAMLREKHAPKDVIAGLVEKLSILDDAAFASTVETISASWKKTETPKSKADPVVSALQNADVEDDPSLVTANEDEHEKTKASVIDFMGKSMKSARGGRPSVFANTNGDA
jgi:hypothetical protein